MEETDRNVDCITTTDVLGGLSYKIKILEEHRRQEAEILDLRYLRCQNMVRVISYIRLE